ncbi:MAG: GPW/gp25 family protein [Clostridiales Family XIII bacterium]|jgi:phage baseplate assembly protein W|nr:GPW/gp25 family protein [Clostridiales Family XIII bacterium]
MDENKEAFLGTGMKFPPRININSGRFATSSGAENVKESVYIILMTGLGERRLEPAFGSRIMRYTFIDTSPAMLNMLSSEIRNAILGQEPRISDVDIDFEQTVESGCLIVNIAYRLSASNTVENMVFPFYLGLADTENADE